MPKYYVCPYCGQVFREYYARIRDLCPECAMALVESKGAKYLGTVLPLNRKFSLAYDPPRVN